MRIVRFTTGDEPAYGVLTGHLVFLAVLAFRSQGLFPRTVAA